MNLVLQCGVVCAMRQYLLSEECCNDGTVWGGKVALDRSICCFVLCAGGVIS